MKRIRHGLPIAALLAAVTLPGCSGGGLGDVSSVHLTAAEKAGFLKTNLAGKWGGTFTDAVINSPKTFNPVTAAETSSFYVYGPVFDSLITQDSVTLQYKPALADSWKHSKDGLQWTFKLRPGLRWSDGQPLTADDVTFSMDVIFDPNVETSSRDVMLVNGKPWKYKKLDDRTVEIDLPGPFGPFIDMVQFPVIPKHKLYAVWKAGKFNSSWNVNTPPKDVVGSGPFMFRSFQPGESVTYERNPYYWKLASNGGQLPFLEGGTTEVVPDVNTAYLKFKNGDTDWDAIPAPDWPDAVSGQKGGRYTTYNLGPTYGVDYMSFNQNPNAKTLPTYMRAWFQQQTFRQAVSYAIDRNALVHTVWRGLAVPLWSPVSPADKIFYDPRVMQYPYNPAKAMAMLASLGFTKASGDEYLHDRTGHRVEFTLMTASGIPTAVQACTVIQSNLKDVGIKVDIDTIDFNTIVARTENTYDWQAVLLAFTGGVDPYGGADIWLSAGHLHEWNPKQATPATPWEAEIDKLYHEAAATMDQAERVKLYGRWQEIAAEQLPLIYLVAPDGLAAVRNRLTNLRPSALAASGGVGAVRWQVEEISAP